MSAASPPRADANPRGAAPLTLGTAGHIDHGKTALVEALTGTNTDRLPAERERGISIELGFAALVLPSGRRLGVVDVPGHERFVRTMVAGASGVDLFLLVVAADDGVMQQTREHLTVLETLAVPAGLVAVTKADVVEEEGVELAVAEARELLAEGPYAGAEVVAVSARTGDGLAELGEALERAAGELPARRAADGTTRLHVDRSFTLKGVGTVVTGTLWSGTLAVGDEVEIQPSGRTARVRSVEVHGRREDSAAAGQRVALNLAGLERAAVERGDVVTGAGAGLRAAYLVDVALELRRDARALRHGERVHVHHGTRESAARVALLEAAAVAPGERAYAQLRLERALVPMAGDRFVVRRVAPPDTIGGGTVLDPSPRKHGAGSGQGERLRVLERGDPLEQLEARLAAAPSGVAAGEAGGERALESLREQGRAVRVGERRARYFAPALLASAKDRLLAALERLGEARPVSRGALADAAGISDDAARALLEEMTRSGDALARGAGFSPSPARRPLDPGLDVLVETLVAALESDALEPRNPRALAAGVGVSEPEVREALELLALDGRIVGAGHGLYFHPGAVSAAAERVAAVCRRDGAVTIASLRDELGTSRKYAQALLEHLDSKRVTIRHGDRHLLRRARA